MSERRRDTCLRGGLWNLLLPASLLGLAALGSACATAPSPVPVVADPVDAGRMAGEWSGSYRSPDTGRSGSIVFRLEAGRDTAFGDVVMIPRGSTEGYAPADGWDEERFGTSSDGGPEVLRIAFVLFRGGTVTGTLEPYRDPECGCTLHTSFEGELEGDVIEGTFVTEHGDCCESHAGTWRVARATGSPN